MHGQPRVRTRLTQRPMAYELRSGVSTWTPHVAFPYDDIEFSRDENHGQNWRDQGVDVGGIFRKSDRITEELIAPNVIGTDYRGRLFPNFQVGLAWQPVPTQTSDSVLDARGATAIARAAPENPAFSLSTFLGELTQGIPKFVGNTLQEATGLFKKLGDEYLNISFGWLPFVDDVQEFSRTVGHSEEIVNKYVNASGTHIRRRYVWPPIRTVKTTVGSGFAGDPLANITVSSTATEIFTDEYWFSGAFRYYVPLGSRQAEAFRNHTGYSRSLIDLSLTPELLWELAPWSWAVDWFTNVGDVMKNITAIGKDGLVMQHGYVMRRRVLTRELTQVTNGFNGIPNGTRCKVRYKYVYLERRPATPYGFGIDESTLSLKQLGILAALGLSKGTR